MTNPLTIECDVHFRRSGRGSRRELEVGPAPQRPPVLPGRVPRIARLMALAIRLEQHLRDGTIENQSQIAALGHVSRPRVSQIMNLLNLAPDIQEAILFQPRTEAGRDAIQLRHLQPIASEHAWSRQRRMWKALTAEQ